ncbi:class I SAM-dependent methyltransferase [Streptococcus suis]|uniref:class I SAM-dependent methyltransferase n=1 Tax=Streptococcus suis TaxID=1307 RepID=UPI00192D3BEF|nr:class I SAM-dependent methyltransferase [Streptococcus suis]MBL6440129.1 class I SAM-dependent methyltransferase [Streptococcus suis]
MVNVNYSDIASFFSFERTQERKGFESLIENESGNALDFPCASGFRLKSLIKRHNVVYAADLSEKMLELCSIEIGNLDGNSNIELVKLNLKDIEKLGRKFDVVYILEYAIQFLSELEVKELLRKLKYLSDKVFIEIYDYSYKGSSNYSERLLIDNQEIFLKKNYFHSDGKVHMKKIYKINGENYTQELLMYNYKLSEILKIFENNNMKVCGVYKNYFKVIQDGSSPRSILEICNM